MLAYKYLLSGLRLSWCNWMAGLKSAFISFGPSVRTQVRATASHAHYVPTSMTARVVAPFGSTQRVGASTGRTHGLRQMAHRLADLAQVVTQFALAGRKPAGIHGRGIATCTAGVKETIQAIARRKIHSPIFSHQRFNFTLKGSASAQKICLKSGGNRHVTQRRQRFVSAGEYRRSRPSNKHRNANAAPVVQRPGI